MQNVVAPHAPEMPAPGSILDGKYRLVRQLGVGGMGIVYEADHIRLRQPFAVKILLPDLAKESEFLMRFEREARAAATLRSPHIVRMFDVDVSADGLTYMVMELLEGRDLAAEALLGPIALPQLVDWIIQICSALQEAHDNGIVHRDLKPANIFLTKIESGERIAKVLDFGISKLEATSTGHVTGRSSGTLGTPTFMAPEQIRGRRVDARADLWALGVMMYRLLGGAWPFVGKGDAAYMAAVLADPAVPFEQVRPDLPHALASVIMRALEKDPAARHPSATEMGVALASFGSGRGPLPARASLPASPMTPVRTAPMAIVVPAAKGERSDRSGMLDTVVDTRSPERRRTWGVATGIVAGAVVAVVALGAYALVTSRKVAPKVPAAPSTAEVVTAEVAPAAPESGGRPATTGVPPAAASAPPAAHRKRPARPASAASSPGSEAPADIPDHL